MSIGLNSNELIIFFNSFIKDWSFIILFDSEEGASWIIFEDGKNEFLIFMIKNIKRKIEIIDINMHERLKLFLFIRE